MTVSFWQKRVVAERATFEKSNGNFRKHFETVYKLSYIPENWREQSRVFARAFAIAKGHKGIIDLKRRDWELQERER